MIKLFSLRNQEKEGNDNKSGRVNQKKVSAAVLRIQKGMKFQAKTVCFTELICIKYFRFE